MMNLADLMTTSARRSPGATALIEPHLGIHRSFAAMEERTERLATAMQNLLGAGAGERVAALSRNCLEIFELYLAVAKSGTLLFPLNWRLGAAELVEIVRQADVRVVFYDREFAAVVDEMRASIDATWIEWSPGADSPFEELLVRAATGPALDPLPDRAKLTGEPFLALSTGGTTGIPKSAVHTQASYVACLFNFLGAARITDTDTYMMLGQFFHVIGYMPLAYMAMGRPAVITNFDAVGTLDVIAQEEVTSFFCVATMLPRLVRSLQETGRSVPSVELVGYGGAPLGAEVIRSAAEMFDARLFQAWGMTELGPGTFLSPEDHELALRGDRPELLRSCGRAGIVSTVAVLDDEGREVPRDGSTRGELCHRGPNDMSSYWNRPEETELLMPDEWIHSGDLATWDAEGHIFIVDRIKSMLISGGENIFPGEIERALTNLPGVAEVVVIGEPDPEWGEVVRALVVRTFDATITEQDVIDHVSSTLGSYMKPRIVDFLDELPMTATGKIDRRALKAMVGELG